jgi:hypothetical protein
VILDSFSRTLKNKKIVIGIDFFSFAQRNSIRADVEESLYNPKTNALLYTLKHLASLQTLTYSLNKSNSANEPVSKHLTTGFFDMSKEEGYSYKIAYRRTLADYYSDLYGSFCPTSDLSFFEKTIFELAGQGNKIYIYFSPIHALMRGGIERLGLSESFYRWKKDINAIVKRVSQHDPEFVIELWDFATINEVTTESANALSNLGQFYWEPSHYKPTVGSKIINVILNDYQETNFGDRINKYVLDDLIQSDKYKLNSLFADKAFSDYIDEIYYSTKKRRFFNREASDCEHESQNDFIEPVVGKVIVRNPNSLNYFEPVHGWLNKENWGMWSDEKVSRIRIRVNQNHKLSAIQLFGVMNNQKTTSIYLNEKAVYKNVRLDQKVPITVNLKPQDYQDGQIVIDFHQDVGEKSTEKEEKIAVGLTAFALR